MDGVGVCGTHAFDELASYSQYIVVHKLIYAIAQLHVAYKRLSGPRKYEPVLTWLSQINRKGSGLQGRAKDRHTSAIQYNIRAALTPVATFAREFEALSQQQARRFLRGLRKQGLNSVLWGGRCSDSACSVAAVAPPAAGQQRLPREPPLHGLHERCHTALPRITGSAGWYCMRPTTRCMQYQRCVVSYSIACAPRCMRRPLHARSACAPPRCRLVLRAPPC